MPRLAWKWCSGCFKMRRTTEFHKKKAAKDGLQYKCKTCNKEAVIGYRFEKIQKRWDAIYGFQG